MLGGHRWRRARRVGFAEPIGVARRPVVHEEVGVRASTERLHAGVEALGTLVVHDVTGGHGHFMEVVCVVVDFNGPRRSGVSVFLRHVHDEARCVRLETVDVAQESRTLLVNPNAINVRVF